MPDGTPELPTPVSLRKHLLRSLIESHRRRPVSFYLLFALLAVVLLGGQLFLARDDPKRFAFLLSLLFLVCFVIVYRAIADAVDIMQRHRRESRELYQQTLGDRAFTNELGDRVAEKRSDDDAHLDWRE